VAPFGSWESPLKAAALAGSASNLSDVKLDALDQRYAYFTESRPAEKGRYTLLRRPLDGSSDAVELTPAPFNVRTLVHEYGGGAFGVSNGVVVFSNMADGRLYRLSAADKEPVPITAAGRPFRYADMEIHSSGKYLLSAREDHSAGGADGHCPPSKVVNTLVALSLYPSDVDANSGNVLVGDHDFVTTIRFDPSNDSRFAVVVWDHPNMPWDHTKVLVGELPTVADGEVPETLASLRAVAGNDASISEAAVQPTFAPDGTLYLITDRSGFWNPYRVNFTGFDSSKLEPVLRTPIEGEFTYPQWQLGWSFLTALGDGTLIATYFKDGVSTLVSIDATSGKATALPVNSLTDSGSVLPTITSIDAILGATDPATGKHTLLLRGASPYEGNHLISYDIAASRSLRVVRRPGGGPSPIAQGGAVPAEYVSVPREIKYPTKRHWPKGKYGPEEEEVFAYAYYYPPTNPSYKGPAGELPPLFTLIHGGPTGNSNGTYSQGILYYTSRGFGVLDVNHGGSSGYGRAFRQRLNGNWGVVDVEDCAAAALHLASTGVVDRNRMAIKGGSAGGFAVLASLTFRPDVFRAGLCLYGISNLITLTEETHKFESRYNDSLLGPYPEAKKVYDERSPINSADKITAPVLFLHGTEDKVVPINQSEMLLKVLREKNIPSALIAFEGEQHGFRIAKNIERTYESQLFFLGKAFGFKPADNIEPVDV
ncbi:alpha/beta-hydrolase, partial [Ramicandelaber brevisporus]